MEEVGEGSSCGETFEVRTIITIKQGHGSPLFYETKSKITMSRDGTGSLQLRPLPVLFFLICLPPARVMISLADDR